MLAAFSVCQDHSVGNDLLPSAGLDGVGGTYIDQSSIVQAYSELGGLGRARIEAGADGGESHSSEVAYEAAASVFFYSR
jgi:hypothetical protein